jgi:hypothetical protein
MADNKGKTVHEILRGKHASIKQAPLDPGSPGWDDIMDELWEDIVHKAGRREHGYQTFKKLLSDKRFDR